MGGLILLGVGALVLFALGGRRRGAPQPEPEARPRARLREEDVRGLPAEVSRVAANQFATYEEVEHAEAVARRAGFIAVADYLHSVLLTKHRTSSQA